MSELKQTVDAYINSYPKEVQTILRKVQKIIATAAPDAIQSISYGVPAFKLNGRGLIYFAAYKKHISIYPASDEMEQEIKEVSKYRTSKGTIQFQLDQLIPYDLIKEIIRYKVKTSSIKS